MQSSRLIRRYVTASHGDGSPGSSSESASMVLLAQGSDVDAWTSYDGKHVTCALGAMWWPSDTGLPLGEPRALRDVQVLLDDGEEFSNVSNSQSSETSTSASSSSAGDYILPDSSTRLYSASELQSYSQYELMLARNEIMHAMAVALTTRRFASTSRARAGTSKDTLPRNSTRYRTAP